MLLNLGRIAKPHGLAGEVVVELRTDDPELHFVPGAVRLTDSVGPLTITSVRGMQGGYAIVAFQDVSDRDGAERLRGAMLQIDSDDVPPTGDPDVFHDHQLVGLTAVDSSGAVLGVVKLVDHAPAHDLLVVSREGAQDALVPFVKQIVPEVDLDAGRVVITAPDGLWDL